MKSGERNANSVSDVEGEAIEGIGPGAISKYNIGDSLDSLVEYLVDNNIEGIHPLIMGEVERRLIIKVLERSRGNKLRAAKSLGLSRNTFHRKVLKLKEVF
jgi:DNA-binding protein Fis